jgi:hypothetical protein
MTKKENKTEKNRLIDGLHFIEFMNLDTENITEEFDRITHRMKDDFPLSFQNMPKSNPVTRKKELLSLKVGLKIAIDDAVNGSDRGMKIFISEYWTPDFIIPPIDESNYHKVKETNTPIAYFGTLCSLELLLVIYGRSQKSIKKCKNCGKYFVTIHVGAKHCSLKCNRDNNRNRNKEKYNSIRRERKGLPINHIYCDFFVHGKVCKSKISVREDNGKIIDKKFLICPKCKNKNENPHWH